MAYTHTWNSSFESTPADADDASEGALRIRNTREAIRERIASDHYMAIGGTDADHGKHQVITFVDNAADPSNPSGNQRVIWNNAGTVKIKDDSGNESIIGGFASGTKMLFKQSSAPTGWTFTSEDNDRVLLNTSTEAEGGDTGGSWTIDGWTFSVDGHTLTVAEMPAHDHSVMTAKTDETGSDAGEPNLAGYSDSRVQSGPSSADSSAIENTGGGGSHTHGFTSSHDGSWRPAYAKVITCSKD